MNKNHNMNMKKVLIKNIKRKYLWHVWNKVQYEYEYEDEKKNMNMNPNMNRNSNPNEPKVPLVRV